MAMVTFYVAKKKSNGKLLLLSLLRCNKKKRKGDGNNVAVASYAQ